MSPMFYSMVVAASLIGQAAADDVAVARERSIRAAIRQLNAKEYSIREQAYRLLWRQGLAAESALQGAAKSGDGETRLRARRLLRDFEYGILPGTDVGTRQLIRDFRDGGRAARGTAFQRLVRRERIEILERLIRLEADPQVRRLLLTEMFRDERIVDRFIQRDRIDALIAAVGADQGEAWKRAVTIQLMFAPNVLSRLSETGLLDKSLQLIRDETDTQARQAMLVAIFRTPGVGVVLARNELDFVLDTLRAEPDKKVRGALLGEIFANPQAAQAIVAHKQLDAILAFSRSQTDAASQQKLVELVLASTPVIDALLKEGGVERVIALVSKEPDPVRRGRLLGAAISSSSVRTFLQRNGLSELAIKLAKEETNEAARHEFLQALLHDTSFVYSLTNEATVAELWQLIKADSNATWRAQALVVLLQSHRSNALLKDQEEAAWILKLASDETVGPAREDILRFLLPNVEAQRVLIANGHFDTMFRLARELPIRSRGEILGNFLAGAAVAEHLVATNRIELLIDVANDEPDAGARQLCLQGIFRNSTAMTGLLEAGHYTTLRDLIQRDVDSARRANLFGAFIQDYRVMEELAKRGESNLLLEYAESEAEGVRRQFLPRLFQNHRAVALLMDEGHFERLVTLAKLDGGSHFDEFLAVPKVFEHLAATKQFKLFLDFATDEADDNTRRILLRNVFVNSKNVEVLIASGSFDRLLRLIQGERDTTWRASLLGPVISSSAVISHFATLQKLDVFLSLISDDPEPVVRTRLVAYLTSRGDALNVLIQRGQLDTLIALVNRHMTGQARGVTLASIVTNTNALDRLKTDQRVGLLLVFSADADAEFTSAYISRLFLATNALDLLTEHGYFADMVRIATARRDASIRTALFARLLNSREAVEHLIARNDLPTLVAIVKSGADERSRRDYLRAVCGNELLIGEMLKTELFAAFVEALRAEPDGATRHRQLATLVYSEKAIAQLAADEQLEQILSEAIADSDQKMREDWLSTVVQRSSSFAALVNLGYGEMLLDATETRLAVDRQQSLLRSIFSNQGAVSTMIEQGKFERLVAAAKRNGGSQIGDLLRSPIVVDHLIETKQLAVLLTFIAEEPDLRANYSVLSALLSNAKARKELMESGRFETLCVAVANIPDASRQASLLSRVFSAPDVTRHYVDTGTLDRLFVFIEHTTPAARLQILSSMFGCAEVIDPLVEQGHFEALLRITNEHVSGAARQRLLAQLLTSSQVLAKLVADGEVAALLPHATEADGSVSVAFARELFANRAAIGVLIEQGHFDELFKLATLSKDSKTRIGLLGQLLAHDKALALLAASARLAEVVKYAKDEPDAAGRRAYLSQICSHQRFVAELIRAELFDELVEACESDLDANERRRLLAVLLHSDAAIEWLAAAKRLPSLIADSLAEPDKNRRQAWLHGVFGHADAFAALMKHGFGDRLMDAAEQELEPVNLQNAYRSMISSSAVISAFATSGRYRTLFTILAEEPLESRQVYVLYRIVSNDDALRAITKGGELDELLARVANVSNESQRESLQRQILVSYGTISALAEQDKLLTLFELIRDTRNATVRGSCLQSLVFNDRTRHYVAQLAEPAAFVSLVADEDQRYRSGIVMRLASDANLRRRWIEAGNLAALEKLVALSPSAGFLAQHRHDLYYTSSGVLGHLLRQEQFEDAEALLSKDGGDRAMSWLASYYISRGQLAEKIERLRPMNAASRSGDESRLLVYLLRANGDLAAATETAESMGEPQLLRPLLVEQRRWSEAAVLQAQAPLPPPVALPLSDQQDENTQRVEQLALLAAYHRLAGDEAATNDAIAELMALAEAHRSDSQLGWHAAQALLLNDRVDEGLRLSKAARPLVAFGLFASRHEYRATFESIGVGEDFVADRRWYDAMPVGTSQADVRSRFQFAITVASTLRAVGREQAAESVFSLLEQIINGTPTQGNWPTQNDLWQWYSGGLYRIGLKDRAWNAATNVINGQGMMYPPGVLGDIFANRVGEARTWWLLFHQQNGTEAAEQRLARIDAVLNPATVEAIHSFPDLVKQAIEFGKAGQDESYWRGVADTCVALGQRELAIACFEQVADKTLDTTVAYANVLFSAERWAEAADAYYDAWLEDYDRLGLLFLAGIAKHRVGEAAEGDAWQRLADLQAVTPQARYQLALALTQRGLAAAANEQWQKLLRTAPFESLELNDAARQLAMSAYHDQPASAAPLWQHYMLGDVRPAFWFLNAASYLTVPALLHKIQAMDAIERTDFKAAEREIRAGLALCPGDTNIAEEVVPLLDAAGQREIGDRFVSQVAEHYEKLCAAYPNFGQLHNNLAWATARCHRRLDEAMSHAKKALEIEPGNAAYMDTLAEVHFQLGDRDQAIHWSEQAVALQPLGKSLQSQLTRFHTEPLPAH